MDYLKPKFSVLLGGSEAFALGHERTFGPKCPTCGEPQVDHEPEGHVAFAGHGLLSCDEIKRRKDAGEVLEFHPPDTTTCTNPECLACKETM